MEKMTTNPGVGSFGEVHSEGRNIINKVTAIPEQHYLSIAFLGALIIFRSSSQQIAVRSVISMAALLILWQILLFMRTLIPAVPSIVYASFVAVAIGTISSELFSQVSLLGITTEKSMLPEQLYLLLCVPVMVFQAEHRIAEVRYRTLKAFLVFSGFILLIATVRELLGDGSLFGRRILPEVFPSMALFRHSSSAAFMIAAIMVLVQWMVQRKGKENLSFMNPAKENSSGEIPYLKKILEKRYLQVSFLFLVTTILSGVFPMVFLILFGSSGTPLTYLMPATVLTQGMMIGLIYLFAGALRRPFSEICLRSMVLPIQTMILLLPFYFTNILVIPQDRIISCVVFYFAYLIAGWIFAGSTMLFIRAVRRKLIFGIRPAFVDGLPLSFIILGISLIIVSGFVSIVDYVMIEMFIP